jgi:integrase
MNRRKRSRDVARVEAAACIAKVGRGGSPTTARTTSGTRRAARASARGMPSACCSAAQARENNLPVIPRAERLTFDDAAQAIINDFSANGKRSEKMVRRRIAKHLTPFFSGRRLAGITAADVTAYITHRQAQGIVRLKHVPVDGSTDRTELKEVRVADVSNAEINRETALLKRIFSLAIKSGRIAMKPHITMLRESAPRSGFFDQGQVDAIVTHLPAALGPIVQFAFITGWRLHSEILPLEWRQVDFDSGVVKLDAGKTKNGEPRTFPMTADLRTLLKAQHAQHEGLKKAGHITPPVFWRMVAEKRGGEKKPKRIKSFTKAWRIACRAAGPPGRIPHDLRRSAVRTFVRAGIGEHVAMKLSGHLTPSVFRRYDIVSDGDLRDAARQLDASRLHLTRANGSVD